MLTRELARRFPGLHEQRIRCLLLDVAPRVLPELSPRLSKAAHRTLSRRGVEIRNGTSVDEATTGGVRLSDGEFGWGDGWVVTSVAGLALMEIVGGAVLAPRGKALHDAIMSAPAGPIDASLRQKVTDPAAWGAAAFETSTALAIVYLMTNKPSGLASALIVAVCAIGGALIGVAAARGGVSAQQQPAAASAPSS